MIDAVTNIVSLNSVSTQDSASIDEQIRTLNAQIEKLRSRMSEIKESEDDQKTKEAKLNQIQQQIINLEARLNRLHAQQALNTANTTGVNQTLQTDSSEDYEIGANIDVYASLSGDGENFL